MDRRTLIKAGLASVVTADVGLLSRPSIASAITVPFKQVYAEDYGASPNATGTVNAAAIQAAIDSLGPNGGTVVVGDGAYNINVNRVLRGFDGNVHTAIELAQPGLCLQLSENAILRVEANSHERYNVVRVSAADCAVRGGRIKGDVRTHTGSTGEWGHGIEVTEGGHRLMVDNIRLDKCWGDGICIGDTNATYTTSARPVDIVLNNVRAMNNRRQGCSIIAADRLRVYGGIYGGTGSIAETAPAAGFAFESNSGGQQSFVDARMVGVSFLNNRGRGTYVYGRGGLANTVQYVDCKAIGNQEGFHIEGGAGTEVTFIGCTSRGSTGAGGGTGYGFSTVINAAHKFKTIGCESIGDKIGFFVLSPDAILTSCRASKNAYSGFFSGGAHVTMSECVAEGNNTVDTYFGQFHFTGANARVNGCHSASGGTAKTGYYFKATATGSQLIDCTATGNFAGNILTDETTDLIAFPKP